MNPRHAKKCPSCLEGHGFSWANIFYRFGLNSEVWRSKGNLCLAIPSVSYLIGRMEIMLSLGFHMLVTVVTVYKRKGRIASWFSLCIAALYRIKGKPEDRICNIASIWWIWEQGPWDSLMAATTLFACCMFHAMHCFESRVDWLYRDDAQCLRQIQITAKYGNASQSPAHIPGLVEVHSSWLIVRSWQTTYKGLWILSVINQPQENLREERREQFNTARRMTQDADMMKT